MRTILLCCALALGGCASVNRHSVLPPLTAKIPQSLKLACQGVIDIPERDLTVGEVGRLWAKDRKALASCVRRHAALAKAAAVLEAKP